MSLVLPWEVIEIVIDHASDDLDLLRSFVLTCRQLRPCSFSLIMAQYVFLNSRDRASAFCDFLQSKATLRQRIHSISISPADFRPFPLINMLPRLSTLFVSCGYKKYGRRYDRPIVELHPTIINCYHSFGRRIHTLSLDHLSFRTPCDFFRLVLAFPRITQLTCNDILIASPGLRASAMEVVRRKLSKQLPLEILHVRIHL